MQREEIEKQAERVESLQAAILEAEGAVARGNPRIFRAVQVRMAICGVLRCSWLCHTTLAGRWRLTRVLKGHACLKPNSLLRTYTVVVHLLSRPPCSLPPLWSWTACATK